MKLTWSRVLLVDLAALIILGLMFWQLACAPDLERQPGYANVYDATARALDEVGIPREATDSRLAEVSVDVVPFEDGGTYDDRQFFSVELRAVCRNKPLASHITVSRTDLEYSELPLSLLYVLTNCSREPAAWDVYDFDSVAATAMKYAREPR